jgi:hypothetical protein
MKSTALKRAKCLVLIKNPEVFFQDLGPDELELSQIKTTCLDSGLFQVAPGAL